MKESTFKEILEAHSSDLKKHFAALLGPVNKELALLREELQSRDLAIAELKKEVTAVKATNNEILTRIKGSRQSSRNLTNSEKLRWSLSSN